MNALHYLLTIAVLIHVYTSVLTEKYVCHTLKYVYFAELLFKKMSYYTGCTLLAICSVLFKEPGITVLVCCTLHSPRLLLLLLKYNDALLLLLLIEF